jgi:hypothetical protein
MFQIILELITSLFRGDTSDPDPSFNPSFTDPSFTPAVFEQQRKLGFSMTDS